MQQHFQPVVVRFRAGTPDGATRQRGGEGKSEESDLHADAPSRLGSPAMLLQPGPAALQRECAKRPTRIRPIKPAKGSARDPAPCRLMLQQQGFISRHRAGAGACSMGVGERKSPE